MPRRRSFLIGLAILIAFGLISALAYRVPAVHDRLAWRLESLQARIKYALNPPENAVFMPLDQQGLVEAIVQATLQALTPSLVPSFTPSPSTNAPVPTLTPATLLPTLTATLTPTPLPYYISLDGVVYVDQHNRWNYCAPANLAMALKFWGWSGTRDDIAAVVKPGVNDPDLDFIQRGKYDKNVMPYELANYVEEHTNFGVVIRHGGEIELIKRFLAHGFPVVVEKGYYEADYTGKVAWLGHYQFVTGYDEGRDVVIVQDAYLENGRNLEVDYSTFIEGWRSFNYLFMVIYPPEMEEKVVDLLGPWADTVWANQHALEIAEREAQELTGIDEFFAWFNKGTSNVGLQRYSEAAIAYDMAFQLYSQIGAENLKRPYRIFWYQTGPYWAYYYTGRYQDTLNLANYVLYQTISEPTLEESLYWRALAREALGDVRGAIADLQESVRLNPNFEPGWAQLARLQGGD